MAFPANPSIGDSYFEPSLGTTYIWYGDQTGWQRSVTKPVMNYFDDVTLDDVRTDGASQTFTYDSGGRVIQIQSSQKIVTIIYDQDNGHRVKTVETFTATEETLKTFNYNEAGVLTSTTVT